jgi:tRNA U34 2-thiouridine synthase MnmA/TrmU
MPEEEGKKRENEGNTRETDPICRRRRRDIKPKVVLAYSGGLDTSVILTWLCEKGFAVIAFCADVGQHHEDFEAVKKKAVACGAIKCIVTDLRAEFVSEYVFESVKCNAIYESRYLLGTSIARPCITKEMIRIATEEGATFVAHGDPRKRPETRRETRNKEKDGTTQMQLQLQFNLLFVPGSTHRY